MGEHRRCAAAVLVAVGTGEIGATSDLGPELDEGFGRRQPLELHPVLGIAAVGAEHRLVHQRCISEIPHMRMLLVEVADAGAETAALQADAVPQAKRLEPGFLDLGSAIERGNDRLAAPVGVDVGGQHQLGVV